MLRPVTFNAEAFRSDSTRADAEAMYLTLLEVAVIRAMDYLTLHPDTPQVYQSGVVAQTFSVDDQHQVVDIVTAIERGRACVDGLAAWRCAELRRRNLDAKLLLKTRSFPSGNAWLSLKILLPDGSTEDPFTLCAKDDKSKEVVDEFPKVRATLLPE